MKRLEHTVMIAFLNQENGVTRDQMYEFAKQSNGWSEVEFEDWFLTRREAASFVQEETEDGEILYYLTRPLYNLAQKDLHVLSSLGKQLAQMLQEFNGKEFKNDNGNGGIIDV